ncbi:MAG TPA: MFS transporter [Thermomicrobiales bacterium]|nr:MFS transporter [Thermomicrobiales bacterium]
MRRSIAVRGGRGAGAVDLAPPPGAPATGGAGAAARAGRYAAYVFWLMFAINFLNYADRWVFSALGPQLKAAFRFDDFQLGVLGSAFLLVYTLVAFPTGYIADRVGRKNIVAAGVALWSAATALTAVAGTFLAMLAVRAAVGVGEGSYYPAGTSLLSAYAAPPRRATVLARWGVGALAGAGIGFLVAGVLAGLNWRLAFYFTGIPGLALAALMWRVREKVRHEDDPPEAPAAAGSVLDKARAYLGIPTLRVILATHALGFFALASLASFLVIYLGATYGSAPTVNGGETIPAPYPVGGLGPGLVALIPGAMLLVGGIAGNLAGSAWANRLSGRLVGARVFTGGVGFLLAAPCVAATLLAPHALRAIPAYRAATPGMQVALGVAAYALFGTLTAFLLNVYGGPMSAALQDVVSPRERAAAGGLELTLAHLVGDTYAAAAVGALSVALGHWLGGEQIGLALLLTCPVALVAAGVVGIWGSRFYGRDIAALGVSAEAMLGTAPAATGAGE